MKDASHCLGLLSFWRKAAFIHSLILRSCLILPITCTLAHTYLEVEIYTWRLASLPLWWLMGEWLWICNKNIKQTGTCHIISVWDLWNPISSTNSLTRVEILYWPDWNYSQETWDQGLFIDKWSYSHKSPGQILPLEETTISENAEGVNIKNTQVLWKMEINGLPMMEDEEDSNSGSDRPVM